MVRFLERRRQRLAHYSLMAETIVYLLAARVALAVFSFQHLVWLFERPTRQPELTGEARVRARKEVLRAIYVVKRKIFRDKTTCFHHAIAAQAMLRRRRVSTTLFYGAAQVPERGLVTHVWLQDGANGVVGHLTAKQGRYRILARYPSREGM